MSVHDFRLHIYCNIYHTSALGHVMHQSRRLQLPRFLSIDIGINGEEAC